MSPEVDPLAKLIAAAISEFWAEHVSDFDPAEAMFIAGAIRRAIAAGQLRLDDLELR